MEENKLTEAEKYLLKNRTPKQKLTKEDVLKGTSTLTMASLREFVHQNPDIDGDAPVLVERVLDYYFEHGGWGIYLVEGYEHYLWSKDKRLTKEELEEFKDQFYKPHCISTKKDKDIVLIYSHY